MVFKNHAHHFIEKLIILSIAISNEKLLKWRMSGKSVQTDFGRRLVLARTLKGMTQDQLSRAVKVSQPTIGSAETQGKGSMHTAQFAKVLGVDAFWLATGQGEMIPTHAWPFQSFVSKDIQNISKDARVYLEQMITNYLIYFHSGEEKARVVGISPLIKEQEAKGNVYTNVNEISGDLGEQLLLTTSPPTPKFSKPNSSFSKQSKRKDKA
jgi:transcriptional regulator with XRE-family HTH domain